jgi:hypothetical protein
VAEPGDGAVDDVVAEFLELWVVESPRLHDASGEVLDDDVARGDEALEEVHAHWMAGVEEDALLVAVEVVEESGVVERGWVADDRATEADGVDRLAMLDADDFGAEVGEDARGGRAGDDPGEVADADAGEGKRGHGRDSTRTED